MLYDWTPLVILCVAVVALGSDGPGNAGQWHGTRPNVLIIMADDMGWQDVGFNGGDYFFETPNLHQLALDGAISRSFYAGAPNCSPSRATMLTGTYSTYNHMYSISGFMGNVHPNTVRPSLNVLSRGSIHSRAAVEETWGDFSAPSPQLSKGVEVLRFGLHDGVANLGHVMTSAGYSTASVGKWHIGPEQGFEYMDSCPTSTPAGDASVCFYGCARAGKLPVGEGIVTGTQRKIKEYVSAQREAKVAGDTPKPFFVIMSNYEVHEPLIPYPTLAAQYKKKKLGNATRFRDYDPTYASMVSELDRSVGRVRKTLQDEGVADDTLIMFFSDNGGLPQYSPSVLAGSKGNLFEGGIRSPFVAVWPGRILAGSEMRGNFGMVDILPTLASAAGLFQADLRSVLPTTQPVDGVNMLPALAPGHLVPTQSTIQTCTGFNAVASAVQDYVAPGNERSLIFHFPVYLSPLRNGKLQRRQNMPFGADYDSILTPTFNVHRPGHASGASGGWRSVPQSAVLRGTHKLLVVYGPGKHMSILFDLEHDMQERRPLVFAESSFDRNESINFLGGAVQSQVNKALVRALLGELEEHLVSRNATRVFQLAASHAKTRIPPARQTQHTSHQQ